MKLIPFLITALLNIGVSIGLFFLLLLGLNGFSGNQAEPGLITFIVWAALVSLSAAALSAAAAGYLTINRSMNFWLAALISVFVFVIVGVVLNIVGWFVSALLTSALR